MRDRREKNKKYALSKLGGKCIACGSIDGLEFDHINPDSKNGDIADMWAHSITNLDIELKKCQLLCRACHIVKTQNDNGGTSCHGRLSYYRHHKCRCDLCRNALNEYTKEYRKTHVRKKY